MNRHENLCIVPSHATEFGNYEAEPYRAEAPTGGTVNYITLRCCECHRIAGARLVRRSDAFITAYDDMTDITEAIDGLIEWRMAELPTDELLSHYMNDLHEAYSRVYKHISLLRDFTTIEDAIV